MASPGLRVLADKNFPDQLGQFLNPVSLGPAVIESFRMFQATPNKVEVGIGFCALLSFVATPNRD